MYTAATPEVLLAIGTQQAPHAYDAALAASVAKSSLTLSEPIDHPYGVAERAYRLAISQQGTQFIVLTGESGSGKTRNASLLIDYLARRDAEDARLVSLLAHTDALLSAFGCADLGPGAAHASRVERETCIHFADGRAARASVRTFGLEAWRIVRRPATERNFAIFYQLLAGAPAEQLRDLRLIAAHADAASSAAFAVTHCSTEGHGVHSLRGDALVNALRTPDSYLTLLPRELLALSLTHATDADAYARTVAAMAALGISEAERAQVTLVLAAILLLGNVHFSEVDGHSVAADPAQVRTIAGLLGLADQAQLETTLVSTLVYLNIGKMLTQYSVQQAEDKRDDLMTNLYVRLFAWLVRRVNAALHAEVRPMPPMAEVCVSDLAGFCGRRDSLTQLLYNHAADRLHVALAAHYLAAPQHEYLRGVLARTFGDAQGTGRAAVELCSKSQHGALDILGDESCVMGGTETRYLQRLDASPVVSGSPAFKFEGAASRAFSVRHVGGTARYFVSDWLRQTHPPLTYDLTSLMCTSAHKLISKEMLWERDSLYMDGLGVAQGVALRTTAFRLELDRALARTVKRGASLFTVHCVRP